MCCFVPALRRPRPTLRDPGDVAVRVASRARVRQLAVAPPRPLARSVDDVDVSPHVVRAGRRVGCGLDPRRDRRSDRRRHVRRQAGAESLRTGLESGASRATPTHPRRCRCARRGCHGKRRTSGEHQLRVREYPVPSGTHPHDVAPARDGGVWYTAQGSGELGWLNPKTGKSRLTPLGSGSAPHGVIVGPDGAPWITDGGLNAIVRVDPDEACPPVPLPEATGYANLNTATFDRRASSGSRAERDLRRLDPKVGKVRVFRAPRGEGPYGITTTFGRRLLRLARRQLPRPHRHAYREGDRAPAADRGTGREASVVRFAGRIWISEWNAGKVGMYDPRARRWREWRAPGRTR